MSKFPLGIRAALTMYGGALRLSTRPAIAERRAEVLQAFHDAVLSAANRGGMTGVALRTISELWDLVRASIAPSRRASQVSDGPASPSPRRRGSRGFATDLRHGWRALVARKFDTGLTVGLLAIGLATTGSVFAVADALVLHPVPFPHPERLVEIWSESPGRFSTPSVPRDLAVRWLERTDLFASGGAHTGASALVTDHGDPELIPATKVSPGLFETLGVRPILGRNFTPDEGHEGANHVVIIGADIWSSRFGRAPNVLGQTLRINDADYRVVGVMAQDFRFPYSKQRIWMPFEFRNPTASEEVGYVTLVARSQPGVTHEHITAEVKAAGPEMAKLASRPWKMSAMAHFSDERLMDSQTTRSIWLLFGATVLLMLTVCANVANLGLSQAFSRTRDAAIRSALGATRWRMIRQTMVEQVAIGLLALACALPITLGALKLADAMLPTSFTLASLNALDIDWRLMAVMATLAIGAPLLSGLVPAIAGSRPSVLGALKQEGRSVAGSRAARWYRKSLVVIEVACSVVLLISAALLVRSFVRLQAVDAGFNSHNLVSVSIGFPTSHFADGVSRDLYLEQALARVRAIPGVVAATAANGIPPENGGIVFGQVHTEHGTAAGVQIDASIYEVQPDFFDTLGGRLVAGRAPTAGEGSDHVVISQSMATKLFPNGAAVGSRFHWDDDKDWYEVVGVAADVRESFGAMRPLPQIYYPLQPHKPTTTKPRDAIAEYRRLGVRVANPVEAMPMIRAALKEVNPGILVQSVNRVEDELAKDLDRPRFLLTLMLVFAGAGLVLAAVGVYGVLSCLVAEQLREYGIRLMLGASPALISRTILFGGLGTTVAGLVVGAGVSAALGKSLSSVLFEVESRDPISYLTVAAVLLVSAVAAAWRPARRARRVDPAVLLRNE